MSYVVNTVGWDKVMFGSDYPHPEGLAEPKGFWRYAEGMDVRRTYDFMGDNARRFMGLPIANPDPEAVDPPAMAADPIVGPPASVRKVRHCPGVFGRDSHRRAREPG